MIMNHSFSQFKATRGGGWGTYPGGAYSITRRDFLLPDGWAYNLGEGEGFRI